MTSNFLVRRTHARTSKIVLQALSHVTQSFDDRTCTRTCTFLHKGVLHNNLFVFFLIFRTWRTHRNCLLGTEEWEGKSMLLKQFSCKKENCNVVVRTRYYLHRRQMKVISASCCSSAGLLPLLQSSVVPSGSPQNYVIKRMSDREWCPLFKSV